MSVRTLRYNTATQHFTKSALASTDRDALAFLEAAQIYNTNQQRAIVNLVRSLKRVGLWSKMKAIYPFVGGTASSHKWNLKDPRDVDAAFRLQFNGGITHSSTGVVGNGSNGYANTFCQPFSALTQNSMHLSYYSRTNKAESSQEFGFYSGGNDATVLILRYPGDVGYNFMYSINTGQWASATITDSRGLFIGTRTNATTNKLIRNGIQQGATATTTATGWAVTNINIFMLARNNSLGTAELYGTRETAFATIGDGLTDSEASALYNIVDLYQKRLGRAV